MNWIQEIIEGKNEKFNELFRLVEKIKENDKKIKELEKK